MATKLERRMHCEKLSKKICISPSKTHKDMFKILRSGECQRAVQE